MRGDRATGIMAPKKQQPDVDIDRFGGFPAAGISFLAELGRNNNRDWFEANRRTYEECVRAPALALVAALGKRVAAAFPPVTYRAGGNGGSLMRINRDTRFSADKRPYKTQVAMMFVPEGGPKMAVPGFGLQITTEDAELLAGQFAFSPAQLEAFRHAVLDPKAGAALTAAADRVAGAGTEPDAYPLGGKQLKRLPTGYDSDHPMAEWLKFKGLHVFAPTIPLDVVTTPEVVDAAMRHFHAMAPIWSWLMEYVERRV
jgi:uncharacterized protein (TIGR02453 family)